MLIFYISIMEYSNHHAKEQKEIKIKIMIVFGEK